MRAALRSVLLVTLAASASFAGPAPDDAQPVLADEVRALVETAVAAPFEASRAEELERAAVIAHGDVDLLLADLRRRYEDAQAPVATRRAARRMAAELLHMRGDLRQALALIEELYREDPTVDVALRRAELFDAIGRGREATEAYGKVIDMSPGEELTTRLRLRLAMLDGESKRGSSGGGPSSTAVIPIRSTGGSARGGAGAHMSKPPTEAGEALVAFAAEEGRDPALRNRAAVVLSLLGHAEAASSLFVIGAEGRDEPRERFRDEIRLAEWALDAEQWPRAQEQAWSALSAASIRRDRLYALAVLVEAHRGDDSLARLLDRLAAEKDLPAEARTVWIDLLRETGRVDEAMRLFRAANDGQFTVEMRRELLEMCRQAGSDDVLLATYDEMIRAEPDRVEWREGLARYHLEHGDRVRAAAAFALTPPDPETATFRLAEAESLMGLGLDDLAVAQAEACIADGEGRYPALLFLCRLHKNRGRFAQAEAALSRMDEAAPAGDPARMQLAEAFEQLGRKDRAAQVLEGIVAARGPEDSGEDVEMRLAWLASELGNEEEALTRWRALWERVESVPRRRYVEDRLMTVAARLGKLADIVVELEGRLYRHEAGARESGLLIRLYTKVGDAVSAAEIVDEYMRASGRDEADALREKSLVYLACTDYKHYEETLERLMQLEPENASDTLQQLAMSKLERGRLREARKVLARLNEVEHNATSAEFEAGVLALAGLRDEAVHAYRRGIAAHPAHIDSYLLLGKVMREVGQSERAIGMYQYLVEHADKDDLFTIAIDGLLNLEAPQAVLRWARRITEERLATRHDRIYLYRLIADLSEEIGDPDAMLRALESTLPIAGEQRTAVLRELMDLAGSRRMNALRLAYGRRLLASGELVPPGVYLDLGEAFLAEGDVANASKTYSRASDLPDYDEFRVKVAQSFESAGFAKEALRVYLAVLISRSDDVGMLAKVGELHEQLGQDADARAAYRHALSLLLERRPASVVDGKKKDEEEHPAWWQPRNVDEFDQHYPRVLRGLLATTADDDSLAAYLAEVRTALDGDLARAKEAAAADASLPKRLDAFPRLRDRAAFHRRLAVAYGRAPAADAADLAVLRAFPEDEALYESLCRGRIELGLTRSARLLLEESGRPEKVKARLRFLVGGKGEARSPGTIPLQEAARLLLPLLRDDDRTSLRSVLEHVDTTSNEKSGLTAVPSLLWAAVRLRDADLTLTFARRWLRLAADHSQPYEVERQLDLVLGRCAAVLDEEQLRSLADGLVQLVESEPEKRAQLIALLPKMQERFERPLLTSERALKLIETLAAKRSWGMGDLLRLMPPEETSAAVRAVFDNTAASRRAAVLPQLLGGLEHPMGAALEEFAVAAFKKSLADLEDGFYVDYMLANSPVRNAANLPAFVEFARALVKKKPSAVANRVALARYLHAMGDVDAGLAEALAVYREFAEGGKDTDYRWTNGIRELLDTFLPDRRADFAAVLDGIERANRASSALTTKRLDLLGQDADPLDVLDALEKAVAAHPDDATLANRLLNQYRILGRRGAAVELLRRQSEKEPEREDLLARLEGEWRALGNDVAALSARERRLALEAARKASSVAEPAEKLPPPTIYQVKKELDEGHVEQARTTFRRVWRLFHMDPRFLSFYSGQQLDRQMWPVTRAKDDDEEKQRPRGGFSSYEESMRRRETPTKPTSAYDALAQQPFGEAEMDALVRTLDADQQAVVRNVYSGLARARVAREGLAATLSDLLERVRSGAAGTTEHAVLFAVLEQHPDAITPAFREALDDLVRSVAPADGDEILQLARIHARLGSADEGARLFAWCGYLSTAGGVWGMQNLTPLDARQLVDEAVESLSGDPLQDVVETIVRCSDPGEAHWGRDQYEMLALGTFEKVFGVAGALDKGKRFIERVTDTTHSYKRGTAKLAAGMLARAGRADEALRCLEFGVCEAELSADWVLRPSWERNRYRWNANLGWNDLAALFPEATAEQPADPVWLGRAADSIEAWVNGGRLRPSNAFHGACVLAVRLAEAGEDERARRLAHTSAKWARGNAGQELWALDVARRVGDEAAARTIERGLLERGELYVVRVPEALRHVEADAGAEAALADGEAALRLTSDPEVLDVLIDLAGRLHRKELVERWTALRAAAVAAKAVLEAE